MPGGVSEHKTLGAIYYEKFVNVLMCTDVYILLIRPPAFFRTSRSEPEGEGKVKTIRMDGENMYTYRLESVPGDQNLKYLREIVPKAKHGEKKSNNLLKMFKELWHH